MHHASIIGDIIKHDAEAYGWTVPPVKHDWNAMVENVQNHIRSLNWGYKVINSFNDYLYYQVQLQQSNVKYINAYGTFVDPHTLECTDKSGKKTLVKAKFIVAATGGRPKYPEFPGAKEYCISSDDVFSLKKHPGKTLVVGASYVALECAGFLYGIGCDVTVMVRSILLRGFDQQIADMIGAHMEAIGIRFLRPFIPSKVERAGEKLKVYWMDGVEKFEEFDTVLCAVGRSPIGTLFLACTIVNTADIGGAKVGVQIDSATSKWVTKNEQTSVPHIYAVGDLQLNVPELTPTAIRAGILLARRLFGGSSELMDYTNVPTTVTTEFSCSKFRRCSHH